MTPKQRHRCMSRIRSKDTRPEMVVRRALWHNGLRYRLHVGALPGRPDIVIRRLHTAIFVNGCFWHGHMCQKRQYPQSNRQFWYTKIERNRSRDLRNQKLLEENGWVVIVIWECQLKPNIVSNTLQRLINTLTLLNNATKGTPYGEPLNTMALAAEDEVSYQ
ncbi:MAG: very short patch repair endonuclease [Muribaculaceae bacterium]